MKTSSGAVKALEKNSKADSQMERPPLPLIPEEDEMIQDDPLKSGTFKLYSNPADTTSTQYYFKMGFADGTNSIRYHIKWTHNVAKVLRGMAIGAGMEQVLMIQELCSGQVRTAFNATIHELQLIARVNAANAAANGVAARDEANGETNGEYQARRQTAYDAVLVAAPADPTTDMVNIALVQTIKAVCPYKALEKQKRFMRRKMRKPADMTIRIYVNHLQRINFEEIPHLPPQAANQGLSDDEILDIVLYGIPKSWLKTMDEHDFDPFRTGQLIQLVEFCERLENNEARNGGHDGSRKPGGTSNNKKSKTYAKGKNSHGSGEGKWCAFHETNTHTTEECTTLKRLKAKQKADSDKKPNKTWTKKSDDAKQYTKKELNALVRKVTIKANKQTKKELSAVAKRKKDDDDESVGSLNMIETRMKDVDEELKKFNFDDVDQLLEKEDTEEISV
jgi:hypothetical protein